jgi:hypothetical protein
VSSGVTGGIWYGVHAVSPALAFIAGQSGSLGYVLIWDGTRWAQSTSTFQTYYYGVYAIAPDNAFAVGYSFSPTNVYALRYDGTNWKSLSLSTSSNVLYSVHGADANNI